MAPLGHVVGVPVEETLPFLVPVAGVWLMATKYWIHYYRNRMQSSGGSRDDDG